MQLVAVGCLAAGSRLQPHQCAQESLEAGRGDEAKEGAALAAKVCFDRKQGWIASLHPPWIAQLYRALIKNKDGLHACTHRG